MEVAPKLTITADLSGWIFELSRELDGIVADMANICVAVQQKTYEANLDIFRAGITRVIFENPDQLSERAPARAARICFLSAIGHFISFLDKLIASQKYSKEGIKIVKDLAGTEELMTYVEEYISQQIHKVAADKTLNNPKKLDAFAGIDPASRATCLALFELRRTLEHHQGIPRNDLTVLVKRAVLYVDDQEVKELSFKITEGQKLEVRVISWQRFFVAGVKIALSPQDAYDLVFTIRNFLAPEIFGVHLEAEKKTAKTMEL